MWSSGDNKWWLIKVQIIAYIIPLSKESIIE